MHQDGDIRIVWTGWATCQECGQQLAELIARDEFLHHFIIYHFSQFADGLVAVDIDKNHQAHYRYF